MRPRQDEGFTLVELLLTITMLGLISGPLIGGIFVILQNSSYSMDRNAPSRGTTQDQLVTSQDQQLLDAHFGRDVRSSASVTVTRPACLSSPTGVGVTSLVGMTWPDSSGADITRTHSAWYYLARPLRPDGTADLTRLAELRRASCSADVITPSTALPGTTRQLILNRAVGPTAPTLTCDGTAPPRSATTRTLALRVQLGLDLSTTFSVQAHRRLS